MFFAHRELYAQNVPAFENVANLQLLPPVGAFVIALPMKIRGGSGGPAASLDTLVPVGYTCCYQPLSMLSKIEQWHRSSPSLETA